MGLVTSPLIATKSNSTWKAKPFIKIKRTSSIAPVGYTPSQIRTAYRLKVVLTVAIILIKRRFTSAQN